MAKNVVVAQSGGPTNVINNSLRAVVETCQQYPDTFGTIYGGKHGIEGILKEELINLSIQPEAEIDLLRTTPAAGFIGSCRYKLKKGQDEDFQRVIDVLKAHNIGYFFYIGGNDSMDTAHKIAELGQKQGLDLIATGVPKTIDNDIGDSEFKIIDHTPGYGSIARYWALQLQNLNQENQGTCPSDPVLVVQTMGRKIGYIPASVRLGDPDRQLPLLILLTESGISLEEVTDRVNELLKERGRAIVVISEGFDMGDIGALRDSFGHTQFSSSKQTVAQRMVNHLNEVGLAATGAARGNISGTAQRDHMIYASTVDLDEAYKVGQKAVEIARKGESGFMATILRRPGKIYGVDYDQVPLEKVANSERFFPKEWIASNGIDVTDEFVEYCRPLLGDDWVIPPLIDGRIRYAKLNPVLAEKKCEAYVPETYRKN